MPHVVKLGINRLINPLHEYSSALKDLWNPVKTRKENWHRCNEGTYEWVLNSVYPGREWHDQFMVAPGFLPALLGYQSELPWEVNGVIDNAGATADPAATNFVAANEIGGGLDMIAGDTVGATGDSGDYTAIGWGDNYPVILRTSPHFHATFSPILLTTCFIFAGLVDNTRPAARAAFALPDNGMFVYYDTTVDNLVHIIIRSGAVSVTNVTIAAPAPAEHRNLYIQTSDNGENIKFLLQGSIIVDWVDVSGAAYAGLRAAQLQPYIAVGIRANNILRHLHLHDFRLIMDGGF